MKLSNVPTEWSHLEFWKRTYPEVEIYVRNRERETPVYPAKELRLRALEYTRPDDVKVVILGQDPYHTPGMANGLAFSVQPGVKQLPPSLLNILKEYSDDLKYPVPRSGDLSWWATNCGVLLLNTVLTVEAGKPNSHAGKGWERLGSELVSYLSAKREGIVFMLWGKYAKEMRGSIDESKHLVVSSAHPSPLAAHAPDPFLGSKPFSQALEYNPTIDWKIR